MPAKNRQYAIYRAVLAETEPERMLWLAVPFRTYESLLSEKFGQLIISRLNLHFFIFDEKQERAIRWIRSTDTE